MSRIFAGGHSSGGFFTHEVGCQRGDIVRGIGPIAAGPPRGTCTGKVAVWIAHGTEDNVETGRSARDFWVEQNGCDGAVSTPVSPATTVEYGGCDDGFPVRYYEYDGGHNLLPDSPPAIWDFFMAL